MWVTLANRRDSDCVAAFDDCPTARRASGKGVRHLFETRPGSGTGARALIWRRLMRRLVALRLLK
eukprot:6165266-Pyramimonas_sp.AAC.1